MIRTPSARLGMIVASLTGLTVTQTISAANIRWNWNPGDGGISFFDTENWNPQQVPDADDTAIFGSSDGLKRGAYVDSADASISTLNVESGQWVFTIDDGRTLTTTAAFNARGNHSQRVTLRGGGTVVTQLSAFNSSYDGSSGPFDRCTVEMVGITFDTRGISDLPGKGLMDIGISGGGAIVKANAGSKVYADYLRIGENDGSQGNLLLSGTGTKLTAYGMQMAAGGWAEFVMESGATADIGAAYLANWGPNGIANMVLSGSGTTLNVLPIDVNGTNVGSGNFHVGYGGRGQLIMGDQAAVNCNSLIVADEGTSDGQVTINDAGTKIKTLHYVSVGDDGQGLMTVQKEALVVTPYLYVGKQGYLKVAADSSAPVGGKFVITQTPDSVDPDALTAGTLYVTENSSLRTAGTIEGNVVVEHYLTIHLGSDETDATLPTSAKIIGDLTMSKGAMVFDLTLDSSDHLEVTGTLTFERNDDEGWTSWIDVAANPNFVAEWGKTYELVKAGAIVGTPDLTFFNDGGLPSQYELQWNVDAANGIISVTVIPEPMSLSLLAIMGTGRLMRRR